MFLVRLAAWFALLLGLVGAAACGVGIYYVWETEPDLYAVNDRVFTAVDEGFVFAIDGVDRAQARVKESQITTSEIALQVKEWGVRKVAEQPLAKWEVERRAEKLAGQLDATDARLESLAEAVRTVRKLMDLGRKSNPPAAAASLDELLDVLSRLRTAVNETEQSVDGIRDFAAGKGGDDRERTAKVMKVLERIALAVIDADARLTTAAEKLAALQAEAKQSKEAIHAAIRRAAIAATALLAWIGAGQLALIVVGWRGCRKSWPGRRPG